MRVSVIENPVLLHGESGYIGVGYTVRVIVYSIEADGWTTKIEVDLDGLILTGWISEEDAGKIRRGQEVTGVVQPGIDVRLARPPLRLRALCLPDDGVIECHDHPRGVMYS